MPCTRHVSPLQQATAPWRPLVAWWLAVAVGGCGSPPPPPPPTQVQGSVQAAAEVNPSVTGRPSPIALRIYELKDPAPFDNADFMALYYGAPGDLAADVVAREDLMLAPGESRAYAKTLDAQTRYIGVVAAYRNLEHAVWRTTVPVQPHRLQHLTIRADALAVAASVQP